MQTNHNPLTLTLSIGHNVGDGRAIRHTRADVLAAVQDVLTPAGYTAWECSGMWEGAPEHSTRVEIAGLTDAEAERIARAVPALAAALNQDAVYVGVERPRTYCISAAAADAVRTA